jgi:hypothetical protein
MPGGLGPRTLVTLLIGAVALLVLGPIGPGHSVTGFWDAAALMAPATYAALPASSSSATTPEPVL